MAKSELITIFSTHDHGLIAIARSLMEDAGIEYFVKGEELHSLLNYGVLIGPVEIQVVEEDAEEAKGILKELG